MAAGMTSCVKNRNSLNTDFSGLQPLVELRTPPGNRAGLLNFAAATLNFAGDPDTTLFYVNLASVEPLNKDLTVNVDIDPAAITAYNAVPGNVQFEQFPDSTYSFTEKQLTITAGQHVAPVHVVFFPSKIDPTHSYMLPLSIKDAQGINISANFGTIYLHVIGNPLAGTYNWDFYRWNSPDTTTPGSLSGLSFKGGSTQFLPDNPTTIEVTSGYFIEPRYVLSFDDPGTGLSGLTNFKVHLNPDDVAVMTANGVTVTNGPNILIADPVNRHFKFQYTTTSRYIIDEYYQ
jgi:hypothetical protein